MNPQDDEWINKINESKKKIRDGLDSSGTKKGARNCSTSPFWQRTAILPPHQPVVRVVVAKCALCSISPHPHIAHLRHGQGVTVPTGCHEHLRPPIRALCPHLHRKQPVHPGPAGHSSYVLSPTALHQSSLPLCAMIESCYIHQWITSHIWMSHVTCVHECECVRVGGWVGVGALSHSTYTHM